MGNGAGVGALHPHQPEGRDGGGGSAQGTVTTAVVPRWPLLQVPQPSGAGTGPAPCASCTFFSLQGTFLVSTWKEGLLVLHPPMFLQRLLAGSMARPHRDALRAVPHGGAGVGCLQHPPLRQPLARPHPGG